MSAEKIILGFNNYLPMYVEDHGSAGTHKKYLSMIIGNTRGSMLTFSTNIKHNRYNLRCLCHISPLMDQWLDDVLKRYLSLI